MSHSVRAAIAIVFSMLAMPLFCPTSAAQDPGLDTEPSARERFYCDRTALTAAQSAEAKRHGGVLRDAVLAARELENGFEFELKRDESVYRALVDYVPLEQACCPFFDFDIRIGRYGGNLRLSVTGSPGIKELIKDELRGLFAKPQQ